MVEYGIVVWVPHKEGLGCSVTEYRYMVSENLDDILEFIKKYSNVLCEAKIYKISDRMEHEEFCDEIGDKIPECPEEEW